MKCFFPACQTPVPEHQELCQVHWELVPLPLRKTIVRLRGMPGHDEAVANAVSQAAERWHMMSPDSRLAFAESLRNRPARTYGRRGSREV